MNRINNVSISKAKELMMPFVKMAIDGKAHLPVYLHGSPGLGKSAIIREIAKENDMFVVDLRLTAIDPSELLGVPYVVGDEMRYSTPEWLNRMIKSGKPCIFFLDELSNASMPNQNACYRLVLDREVQNGTKLPDNCLIVAAGNLTTDKSGVRPIAPPLANRFAMHLFIDTQKAVDSFLNYAMNSGFNRDIVGYLSYRSESVYQPYDNDPSFPTARSWEMVNTYYSELKSTMSDVDLNIVISGTVGSSVASDFAAYRECHSSLPDWKKLREDDSYVYELPQDEAIKYSVAIGISFELIEAIENDDNAYFDKLIDFLYTIGDEAKIICLRNMARKRDVLVKIAKMPKGRELVKTIAKYV